MARSSDPHTPPSTAVVPASVFGGLGGIFLGGAVLGLVAGLAVAGEWDVFSRATRLALFIAGFGAAFSGAWLALRARAVVPELGHALVLVGVGLFGPALLVTAQMFSVVGRLSDLVALWAVVAWLAALIVPSRPPLWLALGLILVWSFLETTAYEQPLPLAFLIGWGACSGLALARRWVAEVRSAAGILALWYGFTGLGLAINTPWPGAAVAALLVMPPAALWALASAAEARLLPGARTARRGAFLALLGALVALGLMGASGMGPPAAWTLPALLAAAAVAVALAAQASVCGPSWDMALIGAAALLALLRPWLPALPLLAPLPPVPDMAVLLAVLAILAGFVAWAVRGRLVFETLAASLALAVLVAGFWAGRGGG